MENNATENARRELMGKLNAATKERADLEAEHGQVWDTEELLRDFHVQGFLAPYVVVKRKSDARVESLVFQHEPRFYFRIVPD